MSVGVLSCTRCQAPLDRPNLYNTADPVSCPGCGALLQAELFPAAFREESPGPQAENVLVEGESSCFYHPNKKAVIPCEACGRFLCALCDLELRGQHLCPACLERGQQKRALKHLENYRVRYDNLALLVALAPLLAWPFTLLTAPGTVFFAVRHWNSPTSCVRPTRVRLVLAIILGVLQMAGWMVGLSYAFRN